MQFSNRSEFISAVGYTTRASQLQRLAEGDDLEWQVFYRKYSAMIQAIGIRRHLSDNDLDDLMQSVSQVCFTRLKSFVYEPRRGHFRSFLYSLVRNIADNMRRQRERAARTAIAMPSSSYDPEIDQAFMAEYESFLFGLALKKLRSSVESGTYAAFDFLVLQHLPVVEVVARTGKTPGALYCIKHRCLGKMRTFIDELERKQETRPAVVSNSE